MAFTHEQLNAVETEIANLKAVSFRAGEISVDQEKTLNSLIKLRDVMKAELSKGGGITMGRSRLQGIDD